jgi:acetylornithine deacetylase/succinyl-diaminopimelate desuccinylase-like protein
VVGLSFADGAALYAQAVADRVVVRVRTLTEIDTNRTTRNIIADSPTGNANRVVVVGAHLDSVVPGPGINDNGSGASTILEIAEEMAELGIRNRQQIRFAFWGPRRVACSAPSTTSSRSATRSCRTSWPT